MNALNKFSGVLAVVAVLIAIIAPGLWGKKVELGGSTSAQWTALNFVASSATAQSTFAGGITVGGTNGTSIDLIRTASCTIWAPANTIAATSTQQVECQGATDGTLSAIAGITTDAVCFLKMASSTNTTRASLVVGGSSASSTAGYVTSRVVNLTGETFTWSAAASSSAQWQYLCIDPS